MYLTVKGERVPAIGLGTWTLSGEGCVGAVERALGLGYRLVDTAQDYGNEAEVGRGIERSGVERAEVFLVTKLRPSNFSRERALRTARESLRRLGTEYVDLLLMHWPNPSVPLGETLGAMVELQEEGSVRHVGVSNFSPSLVEEAYRYAEVFCNEVEYHPYLSQDGLLAQAEEMGHLLIAYSPLAKGRVSRDLTIKEIAEAHGKTPGQVALRWIVQQGIVPIPKAASEGHQGENLGVFDFELSGEEMEAIGGLDEGLRLDPVSAYAAE
jgi:diketogulonate reductase-like aldo/keto reductase